MFYAVVKLNVNPFTLKFKNYILPLKERCISEVVKIGSIIIFHLSKL